MENMPRVEGQMISSCTYNNIQTESDHSILCKFMWLVQKAGLMGMFIFFLTVLGYTLALPNGYYHQEYNYKTSSSSFKNNELQHKTDDQGYYRKDGDLEGRVKPVVDANSEHSEYVNPDSRSGQNFEGANTDFSSFGNMRAASGSVGDGTNALDAEGFARTDRIVGSRGYSSGYSSGGSNSYGSSSSLYGTSSNLRLVISRLQQDLERDLQEAIQKNNIYHQTQLDISQLERELKQNLTERLNSELISRYGQQMVRGGMSYSITGGRLQSTANYNNDELSQLRRQLENSLLNQLRTQYSSSSSSNSQYYNRYGNHGYTAVRPVYSTVPPSLPIYTSTVRYPVEYGHANYQTINSNIRYTPITNPLSITSIASRVQSQLDSRLNEVLDETRRKYFSSNTAYSLTNTDVLLERIRNELRSNLTYFLDENIRTNYGTQIQRDGYLYSVGPSGQISTDYNYSSDDLQNLKQQIERNLIEKLNRDFETYRNSWSSHQSVNSQTSYGNNYQYTSTPLYEYISSPRYAYTTPRNAIYSTATQIGDRANNHYNYISDTQQSAYGMQSSGSIAQLQKQLQDDLSKQLRGALSENQYNTYHSKDIYRPQNYQTTLNQLSDELNRNLTRHLQEYSAMGSYAAYGNFDNSQMQRLKTQLQDSLMSQLQQGLQQSYQTSSSYSSSSSSSSGNSNYRPVREFQNYLGGQYRSGIETNAGENCLGSDSNTQNHLRSKRSLRLQHNQIHYQSQQSQLLEQKPSFGVGHPSDITELYQQSQHPNELGQELDEYDTQQVEDSAYKNLLVTNQKQENEFQQVENSGYIRLGLPHQNKIVQKTNNYDELQRGQDQLVGQQTDDSDFTQQVDSGFELSPKSQRTTLLGQGIDDYDFTQQQAEVGQQTDDTEYGNSHTVQQLINSKPTQVENENLQVGKLQTGKYIQQQSYRNEQYNNIGKLYTPREEESGQKLENTGATYQKLLHKQVNQHTENVYPENGLPEAIDRGSHFISTHHLGNLAHYEHETDHFDDSNRGFFDGQQHRGYAEQTEEHGNGNHEVSRQFQNNEIVSQNQQKINSTEPSGKLEVPHDQTYEWGQSTQQEIDLDNLKQQSGYGTLELSQEEDIPRPNQQSDNGKLKLIQQEIDSPNPELLSGYEQLKPPQQETDILKSKQQPDHGKLELSQQGLINPNQQSGYANLQQSHREGSFELGQKEDFGTIQQVDQQTNIQPSEQSGRILGTSNEGQTYGMGHQINYSGDIIEYPARPEQEQRQSDDRHIHFAVDQQFHQKAASTQLSGNSYSTHQVEIGQQTDDNEYDNFQVEQQMEQDNAVSQKNVNYSLEQHIDTSGPKQQSSDAKPKISNQGQNFETFGQVRDLDLIQQKDNSQFVEHHRQTDITPQLDQIQQVEQNVFGEDSQYPGTSGRELEDSNENLGVNQHFHHENDLTQIKPNSQKLEISNQPRTVLDQQVLIPDSSEQVNTNGFGNKIQEDIPLYNQQTDQTSTNKNPSQTDNGLSILVLDGSQKQDTISTRPQASMNSKPNTAQHIKPNPNPQLGDQVGKSFEVTEQGQFIHRPMTLQEAENAADSLINALKNDYVGKSNHGSYVLQKHVYEDSIQHIPHHTTIYAHPAQQDGSHIIQSNYRNDQDLPFDSSHRYHSYHQLHPQSYDSQPYQIHDQYSYQKSFSKPLNGLPQYHHQVVSEQNSETESHSHEFHNQYDHSHQNPSTNKPLNGLLHYGRQDVNEHKFETVSDLELATAKANIVEPDTGVKGRSKNNNQERKLDLEHIDVGPLAPQDSMEQNSNFEVINEETTSVNPPVENLPWWKRFGNKIKQGAADLKKKVVG